MGGGMGISQGGPQTCLRIVTEKTAMAMPEVHIGLFPDVGGSYFLSRAPGRLGDWLALTGQTINAADALYAGLADVALPSSTLPELLAVLESQPLASGAEVMAMIRAYVAPYAAEFKPENSLLAVNRKAIDHHFAHDRMAAIVASLEGDDSEFSQKTLVSLRRGSPLLLCVTLEQLRRGAAMTVAECLRMERTMVRHSFEGKEVLEGIRARVIEKDNAPQWSPATLDEVTTDQVEHFFNPVWPAYAHPLRAL
jgi:enoyl-CoA hydratase/carnithine racemase